MAGNLEDFIVPDFKNLETLNSLLFRDFGGKALGGVIGGFVQSALCSVPRVRKGACVGCGHCRDICPAKAIRMEKKLPKINRKACIQCGLCPSICPEVFSLSDGEPAQAITDPVPEDCRLTAQEAADSCPTAAISLRE